MVMRSKKHVEQSFCPLRSVHARHVAVTHCITVLQQWMGRRSLCIVDSARCKRII